MKRFAALYRQLDGITGNLARLAALRAYFEAAPAQDAAWAVYFLAGGKPTQVVPTRVLRDAALAASRLREWLFDESYDAVGDFEQAVTELVGRQTAFQAAMLATSRVMGMNLADYLR